MTMTTTALKPVGTAINFRKSLNRIASILMAQTLPIAGCSAAVCFLSALAECEAWTAAAAILGLAAIYVETEGKKGGEA